MASAVPAHTLILEQYDTLWLDQPYILK